jgi:activator of 2-hydroxyglutaryl-CoA dehydratase
MASLFEAIVLQNLSVLTRGHTLHPHVLLLGGPNGFIRGMREAWQANIPRMWKDRKVEIPEGVQPEELIKVPENAQYFAALGSVEFGKDEEPEVGRYAGTEKLVYYIDDGRQAEKAESGAKGLAASDGELREFTSEYGKRKKLTPVPFSPGEIVRGFVGVDGGSTSTKAVLLSPKGDIVCKAYQLSNGNPIQDTIDMFEKLRSQVEGQGAVLEVLGVGTNRIRQRYSPRRPECRCSAGRNSSPHGIGAQVLQGPACNRRRRRAGYQAHHSQRWPRQGFQTEYPVFRWERIFSAIDG